MTKRTKPARRDTVIRHIRKHCPDLFLKTSEEFSADYKGGIWTHSEGSGDGCLFRGLHPFNYYAASPLYDLGVLIQFQAVVEALGWFCEWYDSGTMMIWPA